MTEFSKGGLVGKIIPDDVPTLLACTEYRVEKSIIDKYGIKFLDALNNNPFQVSVEDIINDGKQPRSNMETGITELKDKINAVIDSTNWDQFKSQKTLVPTIETKSLLINAVKKCNKIIHSLMEDTINDKEESNDPI